MALVIGPIVIEIVSESKIGCAWKSYYFEVDLQFVVRSEQYCEGKQ